MGEVLEFPHLSVRLDINLEEVPFVTCVIQVTR
jgi:hypothetical protein